MDFLTFDLSPKVSKTPSSRLSHRANFKCTCSQPLSFSVNIDQQLSITFTINFPPLLIP